MRNALVVGIVGLSLLAGCSEEYYAEQRAAAAAARTAQLNEFADKCVLDYGIKRGTPEMSLCKQRLDVEATRQRQANAKALADAFGGLADAMSTTSTTCNTSGYGSGYGYNSTTTCY